jgi:hypothetical protein
LLSSNTHFGAWFCFAGYSVLQNMHDIKDNSVAAFRKTGVCDTLRDMALKPSPHVRPSIFILFMVF